jgi:hypothetical protein
MDPPPSHIMGNRQMLHIKHEADHPSPPPGAEAKNKWIFTVISPFTYTA